MPLWTASGTPEQRLRGMTDRKMALIESVHPKLVVSVGGSHANLGDREAVLALKPGLLAPSGGAGGGRGDRPLPAPGPSGAAPAGDEDPLRPHGDRLRRSLPQEPGGEPLGRRGGVGEKAQSTDRAANATVWLPSEKYEGVTSTMEFHAGGGDPTEIRRHDQDRERQVQVPRRHQSVKPTMRKPPRGKGRPSDTLKLYYER